jgi:hypothetical protein
LGFLLNNRGGNFFFGFTINNMLTGIIPGLLFYFIKKNKQENKDLYWIVFLILILLDIVGSGYLLTVENIITSRSTIIVTDVMRIIGISILNAATLISVFLIYRLKNKYREKYSLYSIDKVVLSILLVEILVYIPLTPLWLSILYNTPAIALLTLILMRVIRAAFIIAFKAIFVYTLLKTAQLIKK